MRFGCRRWSRRKRRCGPNRRADDVTVARPDDQIGSVDANLYRFALTGSTGFIGHVPNIVLPPQFLGDTGEGRGESTGRRLRTEDAAASHVCEILEIFLSESVFLRALAGRHTASPENDLTENASASAA